MPAFTGDDNFNAVYSSLHGPGCDTDHASLGFWRVVNGIGRLCRKAVKQTVLNHGARASIAFFAGLKNQHSRAIKIAGFSQITRGTDQHGGVAIVPAGMHQTLLV